MFHDVSMKSLATKVAHHPALLEQLAHIWGWSSPETFTLSVLLERMCSPFYARSVWLRLEADERLCLYHLLTHAARGKGVSLESLRRKTKLPQPAVLRAVHHLSEHWLLLEEEEVEGEPSPLKVRDASSPVRSVFAFRECCDALAQTGQELFSPSGSYANQPVRRLLGTFSGEDLRDLARHCYFPLPNPAPLYYTTHSRPSSSDPFELQERVAEALVQPSVVFELLRSLPPDALRLFLSLAERPDGKASYAETLANLHVGEERLFGLLSLLEKRALACDTLLPSAERVVVIPHEILATITPHLAHFLEDERTYAFVPRTTPPAFLQEAQPLICYDLAVMVGLSYHMSIEPTKDHRLTKRQSGKIRPLLHGQPRLGETGEDRYPDLVLTASRQLELLQRTRPYEDAKFRYTRGPKLASWSQAALSEQMRQFLAWWQRTAEWKDVALGELHPTFSGWEVYQGRKLLLDQLRTCTPGAWYASDALLYALWKQAPLDPQARGSQRLVAREGGALRTRWKQWRKTHEGWFLGMVASTLFEAGIVDLGYAHPPEGQTALLPSAFQITERGARALAEAISGEVCQEDTETAPLVVQPSFEILVLRMEPKYLYPLLAFAEIACLERVSRLHLCKTAVLDGLAAGWRIEAMIDFLRQASRVGIPQNVEYTLLDWSRSYQEACLSDMVLIDLTGEGAARSVRQALEVRAVPIRQLGPSLFAVSLQTISRGEIYKLLEKAGVTVREETTR